MFAPLAQRKNIFKMMEFVKKLELNGLTTKCDKSYFTFFKLNDKSRRNQSRVLNHTNND